MFSLVPISNKLKAPQDNYVSWRNMFDDFFNDMPFVSTKNDMKIDVRDNEKEYLVDVEIPGMKKEDINIDVEENQLIIHANKEEKKEEEKDNYIHRERSKSSVSRMVYLPDIDEDSIKAKYNDGILSITAPKKENKKKKKLIDIE